MGRYSPKGCTIALSWRSAGPVPGFQTMAVLVHSGFSRGRPGTSIRVPIRIGAPIASAAAEIR
ncbi:Uncharacterised protein [Mycobacterium tuberculosis]|uniref:Uncharacterized protein n=1 Tax=Mycobacterium tuberculosis TaxID=1773 RepID=A0A0U0RPH8_MYCTX|nr:Uncharacterised protein [Mycobacterium tuberculosis]COX34967.1 Uncharacterised protein [Mycobacterium tuberculosis]COX60354.1 Uncharacterised protein [Mycobacterium tuberculosis]COY42015.1 Uncharacterised protein [Mycobacterium tuberculosis]